MNEQYNSHRVLVTNSNAPSKDLVLKVKLIKDIPAFVDGFESLFHRIMISQNHDLYMDKGKLLIGKLNKGGKLAHKRVLLVFAIDRERREKLSNAKQKIIFRLKELKIIIALYNILSRDEEINYDVVLEELMNKAVIEDPVSNIRIFIIFIFLLSKNLGDENRVMELESRN